MATPSRNVTVRRPRSARTPVSDITKHALDFLYNWAVAKDAGDKRDKANAMIKKWFAAGGDGSLEVNDNGSQIHTFDAPMDVMGHKILGLENRRTDTSVLDLDKLDELIDSLPPAVAAKVKSRVMKRVTDIIVDPDEVFALNQEGVITDAQLDELYETKTKWSLNVVKF